MGAQLFGVSLQLPHTRSDERRFRLRRDDDVDAHVPGRSNSPTRQIDTKRESNSGARKEASGSTKHNGASLAPGCLCPVSLVSPALQSQRAVVEVGWDKIICRTKYSDCCIYRPAKSAAWFGGSEGVPLGSWFLGGSQRPSGPLVLLPYYIILDIFSYRVTPQYTGNNARSNSHICSTQRINSLRRPVGR